MIICYIYIVLFLGPQSASHMEGEISSTTTMCSIHLDSARAYWWRGERVVRPIIGAFIRRVAMVMSWPKVNFRSVRLLVFTG